MTQQSLYERLGGADAIKKISEDLVERHKTNPVIGKRFADVDNERLKVLAAQFISMGTGGPAAYEGRDMVATHKGMNINEIELVAAMDDILGAVRASGADDAACNDVLAILYSLKDEVLRQ